VSKIDANYPRRVVLVSGGLSGLLGVGVALRIFSFGWTTNNSDFCWLFVLS
jgi:hypothetical protein